MMQQTLDNFEVYVSDILQPGTMQELRTLRTHYTEKFITDLQYTSGVELVVNFMGVAEIQDLNQALNNDFNLGKLNFSRHFIARLISRFSMSTVDFLMVRIRKRSAHCRKHKTERSSGDGIMLVMNPFTRELITIFVDCRQ